MSQKSRSIFDILVFDFMELNMGLGVNEETHICSHAGCRWQTLWLLFYEDNEMSWKKTLHEHTWKELSCCFLVEKSYHMTFYTSV